MADYGRVTQALWVSSCDSTRSCQPFNTKSDKMEVDSNVQKGSSKATWSSPVVAHDLQRSINSFSHLGLEPWLSSGSTELIMSRGTQITWDGNLTSDKSRFLNSCGVRKSKVDIGFSWFSGRKRKPTHQRVKLRHQAAKNSKQPSFLAFASGWSF